MGALFALLIGIGIIALIYGAIMKFKAGRIAKAPFAPTGQAGQKAAQNGAISVEGNVLCQQPLISPVSQTPCLYYELKVVGSWKEGDSEKSKDYIVEKHAAHFALDDGSGAIAIDATGGGDFDLKQSFDETKKEGFFADIKNAMGAKEPIMFGAYAFANPVLSKANKFRCTEKVLPMPPKLFALGKIENNAIKAPGWMALMLSPKTRDELLGSTAKSAKMALIGGGVSTGLGLAASLISAIVS